MKYCSDLQRICIGCGGGFVTRIGNQIRCAPNCRPLVPTAHIEKAPKPGTLVRRWEASQGDDEPAPIFASWADYIVRTSERERRVRCQLIAKRASRKRLLSEEVTIRIAAQDVLQILEQARGRCIHCRSLAVENRPTGTNKGGPISWERVGRRVGSLEHLKPRFFGGGNERENLAWACLWCNTWRSEGRPFANDHGGYYPHD